MPRLTAKRKRVRVLITGVCTLLLYAGAASPAGMGLAVVLGSLDCTHHLQVNLGSKGVQIVLHHGQNCTGHRHGGMARALTCFAQRASAANPDHVIELGEALNPTSSLDHS